LTTPSRYLVIGCCATSAMARRCPVEPSVNLLGYQYLFFWLRLHFARITRISSSVRQVAPERKAQWSPPPVLLCTCARRFPAKGAKGDRQPYIPWLWPPRIWLRTRACLESD
jgi:hypothetical protein